MKKAIICFMITCLLFSLCACGGKTETAVPEIPEKETIDFQSVLDECKIECSGDFEKYKKEQKRDLLTIDDIGGLYVSKDGKSMMFNSGGENEYDYKKGFRWTLLGAVFKKLDISSATVAKITNTRAIDGTQTDENDKIKLTWTYHPDNGLSIIFEKKG